MKFEWRLMGGLGLSIGLLSSELVGCGSSTRNLPSYESGAGTAGFASAGRSNAAGAPSRAGDDGGEGGADSGGADDGGGAEVGAAEGGADNGGADDGGAAGDSARSEPAGAGGEGGTLAIIPPAPIFDTLTQVDPSDPTRGLRLDWRGTETCRFIYIERKGGPDDTGLFKVIYTVHSAVATTTSYIDATADNPSYSYTYSLFCGTDGGTSDTSRELSAMP